MYIIKNKTHIRDATSLLFEAVKAFEEAAEEARAVWGGDFISWGLLHVDGFFERCVEESCFDVNVSVGHAARCADGEEKAEGFESGGW